MASQFKHLMYCCIVFVRDAWFSNVPEMDEILSLDTCYNMGFWEDHVRICELGQPCKGLYKCFLAYMDGFMAVFMRNIGTVNTKEVAYLAIEFNINNISEFGFKQLFHLSGLRKINDVVNVDTNIDGRLV